MYRVLVLVVCVLFLTMPPGGAKSRLSAQSACQSEDKQSSNGIPERVGADTGTAAASDADVGQALDKILSQPARKDAESFKAPADAPTSSSASSPCSSLLQGQARIDSAAGEVIQPDNSAVGLGKQTPVLQGQASINGIHMQADKDDPDAGDQQLMVEWDRWRNRFLRAVQMQVQANINSPENYSRRHRRIDPDLGGVSLPFPLGTIAWFRCDITSDRRITNLEIVESSGFPDYDKAVASGIRALEGTSLLEFPSGSHRPSVHQAAGIETAARAENRYFNFGDVERYSIPRSSSY